ncbi:MAG: hypothetical protein ACK55X_01830 [Synechococcaceae cyanobacterium]|jgi:hypothetical protein
MTPDERITIPESGLNFGPFDASGLLWFERSPVYLGLPSSHGVKMAEFAWVKISGDRCMTYVVEAQASFPRPANSEAAIQELKEKFANAMALIASLKAGLHAAHDTALPTSFQSHSMADLAHQLVLVIPDIPSEQCEGVRVLLARGLRSITSLWDLDDPAIVVMNRQIAIRQGLIHANANS